MLYNVFSVHDIKADAFLPPFILPKIAQAKRIFSDCVNSPDHQFGAHPQDYTLFRLGTFDDEQGQFLLERAKESLGNGVEFVQITDDPPATEGPINGKAPPLSNETPIQPSSTGDDSPE